MGREKHRLLEIEDVLSPMLINSGVIEECSMHPGCTFIGDEDRAYAIATQAWNEGMFSMDRSDVMEAVKDILSQTPDTCAGCEG